jgi:PilZ domain-containing protein
MGLQRSHAALRREPVESRREERFDTSMPVQLMRGSGVARNVSATGIYFVTDVALTEGAPVSFTLDFNDYPGGPLRVKCAATVVRVEQRNGKVGVAALIGSFEFLRVGSNSDEPG